MKRLDLTGQSFGMLKAISISTNPKYTKRIHWECLCECGNKTTVGTNHLRNGHTQSCGCLKTADHYKDYTGSKYNMLTVVSFYGKSERNRTLWNCKCDCGNMKVVNSNNFTSGGVKSCGCLSLIPSNLKHGQSKNRIGDIWDNMKSRCYRKSNSAYKYYGGRGIKVCDAWLGKESTFFDWAFSNGYEETLTIERIDVNGDYEPSNCTWVTKKMQAQNKRNTLGQAKADKIRLEIKNGNSVNDLAVKYNVHKSTIYYIKIGKHY